MEIFLESNYFKYSLIIVVTLIAAMIITRILRFTMNRFFIRTSQKLNVDHTKFNFLKNAVSFMVFIAAFIVIFIMIPELKALGLTITAGAGVITAILIFASQQAFSNIISGIFIVIFQPFRVNDHIKIGDLFVGYVEDITLRHTVIRNYENRRIVVPNSVISAETIVNSNIVEDKICNFLEIGISYDSDVDKAMEIMRSEAMKHPNFIDNRTEEDKMNKVPPVIVRVINLADWSVNLRAYVWSENSPMGFVMKCDLRKAIKERFEKEGIEIPFPYRTVVFKKDIDNQKE
ncbi:MAG: mechanosensitive ion channel protein MscS [Marinilabiliales bacterium]|nr:MAG: mechanosensitive ion channel protein MscS [Marinilabiliales bacterium]